MNNPPLNWSWVKLGEVCKVKGGYAFKSKDYKNKGIPLVRISNIDDKKISLEDCVYIEPEFEKKAKEFILQKGDILIALSGATTGKYGVYNLGDKAFLNQRIGRLHFTGSDKIFPVFVYYYLEIIRREILKTAYGAAQPNISPSEIADFPIPLPPLPEQKKIVAKIEELFSELDNGIEQLVSAKEQLGVYRQAVLSYAFSGRLVKQVGSPQLAILKAAEPGVEYYTKQRDDIFHNQNRRQKDVISRSSGLPEGLPAEALAKAGWKWESLEEITTVLGDGLHGTPKYTSNGDYFFINGNNLSEGKIELKNSKRVSLEEYEKYKKPLNERTVFVSINGTLGKTAFYNGEKIILGKSACYFNLKENIDKRYVRYFITTQKFTNYANKTATGSTIKNVSLKAMREFKIPLPLTLKEQEQIVSEIETRFSVADKLEQTIDENLEKAERLKQSLLKRAFEGRLV